MELELKGGKIRKITYGQSGKAAQVNYVAGDNGVVQITEDENYLNTHGIRRFLVWKKNKDGDAYIWKELVDMQVEVEFDENTE